MKNNIKSKEEKRKEIIIIAFSISILLLIIVPSIVKAWATTEPSLIGEQSGWDIFQDIIIPPAPKPEYKFDVEVMGNQEITSYTPLEKNVAKDPGGTQLYCIEKNGEMFEDPSENYHILDAIKYGYVRELGGTNPKYWGTSCPMHHHAELNLGKVTYPWFINAAELDFMNSSDIDLAYILTSPDVGVWSAAKQEAVWARFENESGNNLRDQGTQYAKYFEKTQKVKANFEPDIQIKGSDEEAEVVADYKDSTLTIGPFDLTYINENLDAGSNKAAFSGISAMYFWGINSEGKVVDYNVPIKSYIDSSGVNYKLSKDTYYQPLYEEGFVDHGEQVYPKGDGKFYVVIDNPNKGKLNTDTTFIRELMFVMEFQYMGVTGAKASSIDTYKYTISEASHTYRWCHDECNHNEENYYCNPHHDCIFFSKLEEQSLQNYISFHYGERKVWMATVYGTKNINISMDLGGNVWVDAVSGKESLADGVNNTKDVDYPIANVRVTLWAKPEKSTSKTIDSNDEYVTATYTNEYGNYLFENLNSLRKYYVTFEYDGQQYLPTDYLKVAQGQKYKSVDDMVKSGQYNTEGWKITSKAIESGTEREEYNNRFGEIGSAPVNYKAYDILNGTGLINGYNEAYNKYELMGFVLNENGEYYRDSSLALIDSFYTIENGEIKETTKQTKGLISEAIEKYMENVSAECYIESIEKQQEEFEAYVASMRNNSQGRLIDERKVEHYRKNFQSMLAAAKNQISQDMLNSVLEYKAVPNDKDDLLEVYKIVEENWGGDKEELWKKLQFIQDIKILAYTQHSEKQADIYPVYDKFYINTIKDSSGKEVKYDTIEERFEAYYALGKTKENKIVKEGAQIKYDAIYPGQLQVNLGLWRRQEADLALRKDIAYAATRINGKTEVYKYDKRNQEGKDYWEIQLRMRDYNNYYSSSYTRELYPSDYTYHSDVTNKAGKDLELYVTYKITIRNSSNSILSQITEVVDYYDKDYTYIDDLSWVMYKQNSNDDNTEISLSEEDYRNTMHQLSFQGNLKNNAKDIDASYNNGNGSSRYGQVSESDMEEEFNSIYIKGLDGKKLASGEEAYIYLTFRVNENSEGVILDDGTHGNDSTLKQNYVEINGYTTYYRDGTQLPNNQTMSSEDVAGLIDMDSNPGNLCLNDLQGERYEKNFEDDTDRAKSIKVTLDNGAIRKVNGTVWEDERTQTVSDSRIGDGVRQDKEIGVKGVKVQLVEKLEAGGEYVWQETRSGSGVGKRRNLKSGQWEDYTYNTQNKDGYYEFVESITGNYIIRFEYGDTTQTVQTSSNGGSNIVSYNGQDFKSTVYQKDVKNNKELAGYKEEYYNIQASDAFGANLSDAKDLWEDAKRNINWEEVILSGRKQTNEYSTNNVTNHKAEVLASPYDAPKDGNLIQELIDNTKMVAETGIIVLEGEYNRQKTDGDNGASNGSGIYLYDNDKNGNYTINNVDFGLTERPKAQLELGKKVTNVKVTLANGNTLFDAIKGSKDLTWTPKNSPYGIEKSKKNGIYDTYYTKNKHRYSYRNEITDLINNKIFDSSHNNGLINITMDDELMHGATIRVTYELTVANVGEVDYNEEEFYYKGAGANTKVTTAANVVLDYVANNLQFRQTDNNNWSVVKAADVLSDSGEGVNNRLANSVNKHNTIIKTESLSKLLTPGESTSAGLILTQLVTAENNADDRTYNNIAEITTISNSVGRRMAFSVQGNQDPTEEVPLEVDSAKSEEIVILPPFGIGDIVVYVAIAMGVLVILTTGIIFIKKKVLKK